MNREQYDRAVKAVMRGCYGSGELGNNGRHCALGDMGVAAGVKMVGSADRYTAIEEAYCLSFRESSAITIANDSYPDSMIHSRRAAVLVVLKRIAKEHGLEV